MDYGQRMNRAAGMLYPRQGRKKFDPEGQDYDYETAMSFGMGPDGTGENEGHWGSVAPASEEVKKKYRLPEESYVILKGRSHETWDKAVAAEEERGFTIKKFGNRYYSVPNEFVKK